MPDPRIREFTDFFHGLYKDKFEVAYKWNQGKEQKLMTQCIRYFEAQYGDDGQKMMNKCVEVYLEDEDSFLIENAHDLSHFLTRPNKWLRKLINKQSNEKKAKETTRSTDDIRAKSVESVKREMSDLDLAKWIAEDPVMFMKGFKHTHGILKKMNPTEYARVKGMILDILGKDRAIALWKSAPENMWENI